MQIFMCYHLGMKLKNQIDTNADGLKEHSFKNFLPSFIKSALQENGGDYETIYQRMLAVYLFLSNAEQYDLKGDFVNKIKGAYEDFFTDSDQVINPQFFLKENKAVYERLGDKIDPNAPEKHGVAVLKNPEKQKPALYFGKREEWGDACDFRADAGLLFADKNIIFHDEYNTCIDGKPTLMHWGHHAEFSFNHSNQLTQVLYRDLHWWEDSWSKDLIINLGAEHALPQTPKQATQDQGLTK